MKRFILMIVVLFFAMAVPLAQAGWTPVKRLTWSGGDGPSGGPSMPAIAVDSSDNLHLVWINSKPGNWEIYYKKSEDGGASWTSGQRLTWTSGSSEFPAIAVDSLNNLHVVWSDITPGNSVVYYKKSEDGGATWTASQRISWSSGYSLISAITVDAYDNLHVVFWYQTTPGEANSEIYYRKSTDGGSTWMTSQRLTWNSGYSFGPAIAVGASTLFYFSDDLHMVWADAVSGNYEIHYKNSTDRGMTWQASQRITWNSGSSMHPSIAVDSSDNLHVIWMDSTPGKSDVFYKQSADKGATWKTSKNLTRNATDSLNPALALDSSGDLHIVWVDSDAKGSLDIYYKKGLEGGVTWTANQRLTWNPWTNTTNSPDIAVDSFDNLHVVWPLHVFDLNCTEIYYKKYVKE